MDVTPAQSEKLFSWTRTLWSLRNHLIEERRSARRNHTPLNLSTQYVTIRDLSKQDPDLRRVHSQVRQNVAVRIDEGYKRFFEALKEGRADARPPHPIDLKKYRSFTYPQYGTAAQIKNHKVYLSGLGDFHLYDHRKIKGKPKTVTIKFKQGRWHCVVTSEVQERDVYVPLNQNLPDIGVDPGLKVLMTDSLGREFDPPKAWYDLRGKLRRAQKKMSRQFEARKKEHERLRAATKASGLPIPNLKDLPYSHRLRDQIKVVAKIHTKIERIRDYHHKKNASIISNTANRVGVEEHSVTFMTRNRKLAKLACDRAIAAQKHALRSKLGPERYIEVPNQRVGIGGNSQTCPCGASVPKELEDRVHECHGCGLSAGRDHVSANVVSIIAFGCADISLSGSHTNPATGLVVVRRPLKGGIPARGFGGDKVHTGESRRTRSAGNRRSLESSVKRRSLVQGHSTVDPDHRHRAKAATGGKTRDHDRVRPVLAREPKVVRGSG
jgi:transposase